MQNAGAFGKGRRRYNQSALVAVFFFGGMAFLSSVTLVVCGVVIARPTFWALNFENTTCTVVKVEDRGVVQCSCGGGSSNRGGGECFSSYPCFAVHVRYNATQEDLEEPMAVVAYENEVTGIGEEDCSTVPECSTSYYSNNQSVHEFINERGQMNESYSCLYNPENFENVIFQKMFSYSHAQLALAIPSVFFVIGVVGSVYAVISLMSKSKLSQQTMPNAGEVGGMYPTNAEAGAYPPPPPPSNTYGYGNLPPPPPGTQTYGNEGPPPPPPAYSPSPYGGFSSNYPRMQ